jgi:hypothetical protein
MPNVIYQIMGLKIYKQKKCIVQILLNGRILNISPRLVRSEGYLLSLFLLNLVVEVLASAIRKQYVRRKSCRLKKKK